MASPRVPIVVLVGQPNCGKSALFNAVAGTKAETSNFPGTSISHTHSRVSFEGRLVDLVDLPGTYSLCPSDPAERVALSHLFREEPDAIINVVDASLLSRGLELTAELLELGRPMVVAVNMVDLAERKGVRVDAGDLGAALGVAAVPTVAVHGRGIKELLEAVFRAVDQGLRPRALPWSGDVEAAVSGATALLPSGFPLVANPRFTAIKLLETERTVCGGLLGEVDPSLSRRLGQVRNVLEAGRGNPAYEIIAAERHHLAMKVAEASSRIRHGKQTTWDSRWDAVLMHPVAGYMIMAIVFAVFFLAIFKVGAPLEGLLLRPFAALRGTLAVRLGSSLGFHIADGLIQGIGGGVAIVLPYFVPLLFLMAALEDFGYLARAGFLLDAFLHRIGLHGKSVSPFILGFGCNVPAIVATRILESRRDRILTALLIPFIPCSARTTIILALIGAYLGPFWALTFYGANILLVAVLGGLISRFIKEPSPGLILEIPSLKIPSISNMARKTWLQLSSFIKFAWPLLVGGSLALSLLAYFRADGAINDILAPLVVNGLGLPHELGVTLVFGFLRKELSLIMMLQALGVDYGSLLGAISREQIVVFTVFVSFFIPCLSTCAILWKEIGRKWAAVSVAMSTAVAVLLSMAVRLLF